MGSKTISERKAHYLSGWLALFLWLLALAGVVRFFIGSILFRGELPLAGLLSILLLGFLSKGFVILQPNIAGVLIFFGRYSGTIREGGFCWFNPFSRRQNISLRVVNLNTPTLKVNDMAGNPIEVAAVIAWRVNDTAKASFEVEDYAAFLAIQGESAIRAVSSTRFYDGDPHGQNSLRGDLVAVAQMLTETIQLHVELAGLEIIEAKITHLAYAPEIAAAMLRRQQAAAVIAARQLIVEGAVGMVKMALDKLQADGVVTLSDADRVQLASNLLTVLVSESETQPVLSMSQSR
ncbi:SPFH domain-containing protein [Propionivibrio sp.]|uniref:SPFH domain-containing protein n=1 Tax=Propionivibrio sp. TaxID=2212460 RepID=UPI002611CC6D|nr:SPFH domain-containing protein [Propionivibrio sp.]